MNPKLAASDAAKCWLPFEPSKEAPWDLRRVVHLHRRAGFAATWAEIQRDLKDGLGASIDRLLAGKARSQGVPEDFEPTAADLAGAVGHYGSERLKAWWIYRMMFGPDPLTERLTLMWHNHFATSNAKVHSLDAMRRQNELFRDLARAPFGKLLSAVLRDPAMLFWLDAQTNRKGHANENLAREVMELFTLGIGHYSETDVKEAARALTGWSYTGEVAEGQFREDPAQHDEGDKTILGRKGRWKGADLVRMLLEHPATAQRLVLRLCEQFMGEGAVNAAAVKTLAVDLVRHDLNIGWAVETVLRSRAFFAEANLRTRVLGPVEYVVGAARALELFDPAPSTLLMADFAARQGQELFYPPNVGGWSTGRNWISTRAMIGRANYAAGLASGSLNRTRQPLDALGLARRHGRADNLETIIAFYGELLLGVAPSEAMRTRILAALGPRPTAAPATVLRAVALMLASPEAQLA
jgi:uncharacterized protein (DUF1800 family)